MIEAEKQNLENEKITRELTHAYKRLFASDDGKVVLEDLERFCGFYSTSTNNQWNPYQTMFAEGKRRVFLRISQFMRKRENED